MDYGIGFPENQNAQSDRVAGDLAMAPIKQDSLNELETLGSQIEYATKLLSQLMLSILACETWVLAQMVALVP